MLPGSLALCDDGARGRWVIVTLVTVTFVTIFVTKVTVTNVTATNVTAQSNEESRFVRRRSASRFDGR